jgi:hypothetical protein
VFLNQQNSYQILQNQYHQYPMKNGKPEPSELSSSCSRMPPHVHRDHNDHSEYHHSHHEQQEKQLEVRQVAQEQQDEQTKSDQPKSKQPRQ